MITCPYCGDYTLGRLNGGAMCLGCGYIVSSGDITSQKQETPDKKTSKPFLKNRILQTKKMVAT
jgi:hypothetical protein